MRSRTEIVIASRRAVAATVLVVAAALSSAPAEVVVSYHDGAASTSPTFVSPVVTASSSDLNGSESWRTSWGGAGAPPAGPTGGSSSGSNWRLYRSNAIGATPSSTTDYAGFTVEYTGPGVLLVDDLTFDLAVAADGAAGGLIGSYEVFAQVNGGGFVSLGSGSTAALGGSDAFSPVNTVTVGAPLLSALTPGDEIEFRIGLADNSGSGSKGVFVQGIELTGIQGRKTYQIDLDSTDGDGGPIETETGWASLNTTGNPNTASVTIDGVTFSPFSADGSRIRRDGSSLAEPNDLTADFIFEDGAGEAVGLFFGGAGDLDAGIWLVEMFIYDADFPTGDMIVGYRTNTIETIIDSNVTPVADGAAISFRFESDGVSAYDVFVRENNGGNRARLNAVRLTLVPAPAALPAGLALIGLAAARRRRL